MVIPKYVTLTVRIALFVILIIGGISACNTNANGETDTAFTTTLLVRAPDQPLPALRPVTVQSRSRDPVNGISHVELYAVELPNGESNVLISAEAAAFEQTTLSASQTFIPKMPGDYVIKVRGYNKLGQFTESEYIRFTVQ